MDVAVTAQLIHSAHLDGTCLRAAEIEVGDLGTAYAVQGHLTALRSAAGARRIGWKLGYTSQVMRDQLGIDAPNHGPLLSSMSIDPESTLAGLTQPRAEPEIALVLGRSPAMGASIDEVLGCCSSARAALEVVDSVWCDYAFDLEHNTADGSSAAGVVLGPELSRDRLDEVTVELDVDGAVVGTGRGADAAGHPALALAWLVDALDSAGEKLVPGDVVITGGLTRAHPIERGGHVQARFVHPDGTTAVVGVRR